MRFLFTAFFIFLSQFALFSQEVEIDSLGSSIFTYSEGDTTYLMKQYFMVFLESGDNRDHTESEVTEIQSAHLTYLDSLAKIGIIQISGPFGDDQQVRGISIYRTSDFETAKALAEGDPAVKAGRLKVRVRPWWAAVGSQLR